MCPEGGVFGLDFGESLSINVGIGRCHSRNDNLQKLVIALSFRFGDNLSGEGVECRFTKVFVCFVEFQ
jgi:hypothetical protein